ncbi:MAG: histidinol-phosphate transaminase [Burkholderiaceae bacterium]
MSALWSADVQRLTPYVPGEQPRIDGLIKLNTNESPYGPSPRALAAIRAAADDSLRLYPDPDSTALRQAVVEHLTHGAAGRAGWDPSQVFVGNGSDEVLAIAFQALMRHPRPVLLPDISYSFYPVYCQLYGIATTIVPLDDAFQIRVDDYRQPNGGIVIANPNAPTGRALPLPAIESLARQHPGSVVLVDEAYVDFGAESAVALVGRYPNLLVVRTLSKSSALAGLRVGFAVGDEALIEGLNRVKNSFNSYPIDRLASAGAAASLRDHEHFDANCRAVIAGRERLAGELASLGFDVLPSAANFVFVRHPRRDAAQLAAALRERRILVRHFRQPRISRFLRITIGTDAQNAALTAALHEILSVVA